LQLIVALTGGAVGKFPGGLVAHSVYGPRWRPTCVLGNTGNGIVVPRSRLVARFGAPVRR
jgi:hypothetical protein